MSVTDGSRDSTAVLRGAIHTQDGERVVRLLTEHGVAAGGLQLAGDGLTVALLQGVDGAAELATACAEELTGRGWWGDEELAVELRGAMGLQPEPRLRPVPVELDELASHLQGAGWGGMAASLDLSTGELWPSGEAADPELAPPGADDPDRWLEVGPQGSRDGYRDMVRFTETVANPALRRALEQALDGKGAFGRFKRALSGHDAERRAWLSFSQERTRGRARAWLAGHGYRPGPVPASSPDQPPY
jgi:hypothetical protein